MTKKQKTSLIITLIISITFGLLYLLDWFFDHWDLSFKSPVIIQSPIKIEKRQAVLLNPFIETVKAKTPEPELIPNFNNPIEKEIFEVFGKKHFIEAMRILECENKSLNPEAINTNKDGSKDYGVFQINGYWHGFNKTINNERYLFDPSINIRLAHKIFRDNGYSFKLWSCYKK